MTGSVIGFRRGRRLRCRRGRLGEALGDAVDLYLDGGATPGHVSSTVVAADPHGRDGISILREGVIREAVIRKALTLNGGALGI